MQRLFLIAGLLATVAFSPAPAHADDRTDDKDHKVLWQGDLHLGDNPEQYRRLTSAGMMMQVPFVVDTARKYRMVVKAADVKTLAGHGHHVEIFAHYEGDEETPPREERAAVFRMKNDDDEEKEYAFEFDPAEHRKATYFSVRVRVDNHRFGLWDDFRLKRIAIEPVKREQR